MGERTVSPSVVETVSYVVLPGLHQLVHQPTRTTMNVCEFTQRQKDGFAGISEHWRTATTLWICLHTAEVAGSNPASPTSERCYFAGKNAKPRISWHPAFDASDDRLTTVGVPAIDFVL